MRELQKFDRRPGELRPIAVTPQEEMFNEVGWMKPSDWAIIQLLNRGLKLTPGNIAANTGYSAEWCAKRSREMVERRVMAVEEDGDPFFELTDLGEQIAKRELSADEVEDKTKLPEEEDGDESDDETAE